MTLPARGRLRAAAASATGAPAPAKPHGNKNIFLKKVIFPVEKGLARNLYNVGHLSVIYGILYISPAMSCDSYIHRCPTNSLRIST